MSKDGDAAIVKLRETLASASRTAGALTKRCDQWISQAKIERDAREKALSILLESSPPRRGYATPPSSPTKQNGDTDEIRMLSAECTRLKSIILRRSKGKTRSSSSSESRRKIRELEGECERLKRALKKAVRHAEDDDRLKNALIDRDAMKEQMKIQNDDVNLAISEWKERDAKLKRAHAVELKRTRKEITLLEEKYEHISREFKESRQKFEIRIQEMTNSIENIRTREENLLRENETLRQEIDRMREKKKDVSQDDENNELRKINATLSEQVKSAVMEVHQLASERTKLEQELRKIQDERSELEEKYSNHVSELEEKYSNHISELERGYSGRIARVEEEASVATQNHIEKHYRNTIEARRELVHADMKLRNAKIRHSETLKNVRRESISNVENMRRVAEEHAERHESVRDELSELEKKHESLIRSRAIVGEEEDDDEKMREMNRLEREIETLKTLHEVRLKRHLGDLSVSHQKAQIETENRHAKKLETYKSEASRLENELEQVRWDLNMSSARESNVSTEMHRMREDHQIRHDKEIEVVREFEMLLSKAEERERSGAEELILDHENAIEELREAHQSALQHHVSTE
eukprot:g2434.t1